MPAKGVTKFDWVGHFVKYQQERKQDDTLSLKRYCEKEGLTYVNASREFKDLRDGINEATTEALDASAPRAIRCLVALMETSDDEKLKGWAADKLLTQWVNKNKVSLAINTTAPVNVGMVMFANEDKDEALKMLGGKDGSN